MEDLGKLVLRMSVGVLLLTHGISKIQNFDSTMVWIQGVMTNLGMPVFMAYGVFLGEVLAPAFLILGILPRLSALAVMANMVVAILSHTTRENANALFSLGDKGGWSYELQGLYLFGALAILIMGSGKLALYRKF